MPTYFEVIVPDESYGAFVSDMVNLGVDIWVERDAGDDE